ncbi:alkaline phosphatase D family protein [Halomarina pelagica]|uniref:alkaline phosphatase D family protein n=1 Tax=Halomarina pelagica TaxID=2961599 RepID=UPI0020C2D556|nr:alkaline phosphatase D family protein [Halomarina sp. BND7]
MLKSAGAATVGGLSISLFGADLVQGIRPQSVQESDVTWSAGGPSEDVFPLSVASGGPTPSGAILWSKLAADAYVEGEPAYVQVGTSRGFSDVVYEGRIEAEHVKPEHDHVVKVDLDGKLPTDRHLFYRFHYDGVTSQVGRCRTLPNPEATPDRVSLAVVTCQSYQDGYYPAYDYVADEDVDYLVHLGDQIYEYAGESEFEGRSVELPSGHDVAWGLEDFRHLWSTYRGDRFFQRALERHTFIPTWDDHEIVNNRYWDYENDRPWSKDHPRNDDPEFMHRLFVEGIKAWWEYNPARVTYRADEENLLDRFHMWRSVRFGNLLELPVTDERLFRSMPPGGDAAGQRQWGIPPNAPERDDGDRTMLGFEQREWFLDALRETDATWKVWPNEVAVSPLLMSFGDDQQLARNYDAWDGYEHERDEILGQVTHFGIDNFLALTGDMHTSLVAYLMNGYEDAQNRTPVPPAEELAGVELMTPAISSDSGTSDFWGTDGTSVEADSPQPTNEEMTETILEENPHVEFFDAKYNGYSTLELTPEAATWTTYAVDDTVDRSGAARTVLRTYRIPEGRVELTELEANDELR